MNLELSKRIISTIVLLPLVLFSVIEGSFIFNLFLIICLSVSFFEWHVLSKKNKYYYLGFIFLICSFYLTYNLYHLKNDYSYFMFVLIICISTDIGGFIFGRLFKGPKLTSISPKKTYSGAIGGLILSMLSIIFFYQTKFFFSEKIIITFYTCLLVILISSVSQLGDIMLSYFKRKSNVKDTGKIIPGHGGILDRIDGMIFAFPFSYVVFSTNFFKI